MIYDYKQNRTEKPGSGISPYSYKKRDQDFNRDRKSGTISLFSAATRFYSSLPGSISSSNMDLKNCFALTLANSIISAVNSGRFPVIKNSIFPEEFYTDITESIRKNISSVEDSELLIIYLKQCAHMLKECGLLFAENNIIKAEKDLPGERICRLLLESFWNRVSWSSIFPSSPEAAKLLHKNRNILADLLRNYHGQIKLEDFANDFFNITEICPANDFFMISFLDFYLITWLKHFGILEYNTSSSDGIVKITLTEDGRMALSVISWREC